MTSLTRKKGYKLCEYFYTNYLMLIKELSKKIFFDLSQTTAKFP